MNRKLVLGTRGSELAVAQARMVEATLHEKWSQLTIETRIITTSGDESAQAVSPPNSPAGRKGLFTSEIERELLNGDVDLAVHSAKDIPSELTAGTEIAATLPRAPAGDVLVSTEARDLNSLPINGVVATGSVRRRHQLHWKRPDLEVVDLRGNVPTRLRKLSTEQWHGIILARAGLERLGMRPNGQPIIFEDVQLHVALLSLDIFVPAGGQGVVAIQIRSDDDEARMLLEAINDLDTRLCLRAEREFLRLLKGDCNQPVGVFATIGDTTMSIHAQVFDPEVLAPREVSVAGNLENAESLAAEVFAEINRKPN